MYIELDKFDIWDKECFDYIRKQIEYKIRKTKVFISYSNRDTQIGSIISRAFVEKGLSVWNYMDMRANDNWLNSINSQIKAHSYKDGVVLALVTENSLDSQSFIHEIKTAIENDAFIIPVIIGRRELIGALMNKIPVLSYIKGIFINEIFDKNAIDELVQSVLDY